MDERREVRERCLFFEMLCKFSRNCIVCIIHAGSAESEDDEYAGTNELDSASISFLC